MRCAALGRCRLGEHRQGRGEGSAGTRQGVHEHANASDRDDACLFSFNDFPVMEKLGLYAEESCPENGGHQRAAR